MSIKNPDLKNIYWEVGQLKGRIDQMDKNIGANFVSLDRRVIDMHNSVKLNLKNHEDRLILQEKETSHMSGKTAGIAFIVSLLISIIGVAVVIFKVVK